MFRRIALTAVPRAAPFMHPPALLPTAQHAGFFLAPPMFGDLPLATMARLHGGQRGGSHQQGPPLQVVESGDKVLVELDVPRFKAADVAVKVDKARRLVNVRGARTDARGELQARFERSFTVAPELDLDTLESSVADGVATITLARRVEGVVSQKPAVASAEQTQTVPSANEQSRAAEPAPAEAAPTSTAEPAAADAATAAAAEPANADAKPAPPAEASSRAARQPPVTGAKKDEGYAAVRTMQWPPEMKTAHDERCITYSCALPAAVTPDNVDVRLDRGCLTLGVRANLEAVRKDSNGRVVFETSRSVHYSTVLPVPRNTRTGDVSVELKNGALSINVRRHADAFDANNIRVQAA